MMVIMAIQPVSVGKKAVNDKVPIHSHPHNVRGRAFAHGAMGRRIDPSWGGPIELFLVPASAPRLV